MITERRQNRRRKFGYYMKVVDNSTLEVVGYLSDISPQGFKLDSQRPLIPNRDYVLRMDLTPDISDRSFIVFVARTKWTQPDPLDPNSNVDGLQITNIGQHDLEIYNRVMDKYSARETYL